jgi:hypothetical protein
MTLKEFMVNRFYQQYALLSDPDQIVYVNRQVYKPMVSNQAPVSLIH